jgi:protein O-GlcNAc transferase
VAATFQQAAQLHREGRPFQADALCGEILREDPRHAGAWHLRGLLALAGGDLPQGIEWIRKSLRLQPDQPPAHSNIGNALLENGQPEQALASFERALALKPDYMVCLYNRGNALRVLGRHEQALAGYDAVLRLQPAHAAALNNRGLALLELSRMTEARESFERALAVDPQFAEARRNLAVVLNDLGNALLERERAQEALAHYDESLRLAPERAETLYNRGAALRQMRRHGEAAQHFAQALRLEPDNKRLAIGNLFHARLDCCDWRDFDALATRLREELERDQRLINPLSGLLIDAPDLQLNCARGYVAQKFPRPATSAPPEPARAVQAGRLRVAYVSGDLREHPVGYLLAGVLERHDHAAFEIIGVSLRPAESTTLGMRLRRACDRFIQVGESDDADIAAQMRELGVDVAIDLMGFTQGARLGIFANRAAPVQASWLGYPGTTGAPFMDYLIADAVVAAPDAQQWYAEQLVRLPYCYLPNDDRREIAAVPTRAALGLPERSFVFCAFTNAYKINPPMFQVWMRLLREVPDSILWLRSLGPEPEANLAREAVLRGVDPARLVFAPLVDGMDLHLARLSVADLYLDTLPYNAHSTACDALWAGVPVLTCPGRGFAARVAASALSAVGLPELIADDPQHYARLGLELAGAPQRLRELRARLSARRRTAPLFDTAGLSRQLERAYRLMHERAAQALPPVAFDLKP